jgi:hypothetical protein
MNFLDKDVSPRGPASIVSGVGPRLKGTLEWQMTTRVWETI